MRADYFKAKTLECGVWVCGNVVSFTNNTCIVQPNKYGCNVYPVDPLTVCRHTGTKDRIGRDVFEHDFLTKDGSIIYEVGYEDCGFKASLKGENEFIYNLVAVCKYNYICGNKFDEKED